MAIDTIIKNINKSYSKTINYFFMNKNSGIQL